MKKVVSLILFISVTAKLFSQDTLPRFTIAERGDKVIISWINPYETVVQLNVQRSFDSLKYFTTIFSAPSPELPQNGYTDTKKPLAHVYYRIFYALSGGAYFFTRSKSASGSLSGNTASNNVNNSRDINNANLINAVAGDRRIVSIKIRDTIYKQLSINAFLQFRDSILHLTKDTLFAINDSLVSLSPFTGVEYWKVSPYIFVNKDGFIHISLPLIGQKKYNIKFFEESGSPLFEIHNVKESPLIFDKASFVHSGWFLFELYEDNRLKERNKVYLPKDF